jgi:ribosomal protein S20
MPNTKSAKKALRSSLRKKEVNTTRTNKLKNALKSFRKALTPATLSNAFSALDKAVKSNIIPKGRADRKKSRLSTQLSKSEGTAEKKVVRTKAKKVSAPKVAKAKPAAKKATPAKQAAPGKSVEKKVVTKAVSKPAAKKPAAKAPAKKAPVAKKKA